MLFFINCSLLNCQTENNSGFNAIWSNGDVTYQRDLGKVWLLKSNGKTLKDVRISEFNVERKKLVYEKDRTLHDIQIVDVKGLLAGENSSHMITFNAGGLVQVINNPNYYYGSKGTFFKVSEKVVVQLTGTKKFKEPDNDKEEDKPVIKEDSKNLADTLVKVNGQVIAIKLIQITDTEIRYKRMDYLNGPVYNILRKENTEIIEFPNYKKIKLNN